MYASEDSVTSALLAEEVDLIKAKYPNKLRFVNKHLGNTLFNQIVELGLIQFQFMSFVPTHNVKSQRYEISDANGLRAWLDTFSIQDSTEIFICPQYGTEKSQCISLPWHVIKEECAMLLGLEYGKDDTTLFDETGRWVLLYNHNDYIDFATF